MRAGAHGAARQGGQGGRLCPVLHVCAGPHGAAWRGERGGVLHRDCTYKPLRAALLGGEGEEVGSAGEGTCTPVRDAAWRGGLGSFLTFLDNNS